MPTWPKDTKASTLNVDQGSDQISQARADILQNITNVNTIIDTFDIQPDSSGQPANGDLLQYNSATGTWRPVSSSGIQAIPKAVIKMVANNIGQNQLIPYTDGSTITVLSDANNLLSGVVGDSATDNYFTLTAGTYLVRTQMVQCAPISSSETKVEVDIRGTDSAGATDDLIGFIQSRIDGSNNRTNLLLDDIDGRLITIPTSRQYEFLIEYQNISETSTLCTTITTFEKYS